MREALAAVVDKRRGDATIRSLRAEGVYDETRRVVEHGDGAIAIPVTEPPAGTEVRSVVEQADPEPRVRGLADLLAERGWTDEEIQRAPSSWAVVGSVVLARFEDCPRPAEVGDALLELHGEADTVLDRRGIGGPHREPDVAVVAGEGDTETVHVEHGTEYALGLDRVMFSPGNKAERARMGEVVAGDAPPAPETGRDGPERVLDMFAGVGYFALPMARAGARVTAVERNPTAFRYLIENASLNGVTGRVEPYRGDCRAVASRLPTRRFDRAVLGYYDATAPATDVDDPPAEELPGGGQADTSGHPYLDAAIRALAPGGVAHVHAAVPEPELWSRPEARLATAAGEAGRAVDVLDRRRVKTHSEGVIHAVLDVRVA
ncbi:MAG: class I SAM-dependent methyltransferase family protein [Halobacteriales archaeon]